MSRSQAEFQLQCALVDHIQLGGVRPLYMTAIPMGENRNAVTGARIKRMGGRAGAPDLLIIHDGKAYGLELKARTGGRQTESQKLTERDWNAAGGHYGLAEGMDDVTCLGRPQTPS